MQYVDGKDLSAIVKEQGPLSVAKAVRCVVQAAKGLQYAHDNGVTHRDVKPANLLLDNVGNIKLLDMGLARIDPAVNGDGYVATQAELTQPDAVMGTVDYMSPEQAVDTKHADARADIYSLGCTLYYILTGKPPYTGNTLMARMIAHREADIPSLSDEREDVSEQLDNISKRMLAKNPEERYPTMTALLEDLEVVADELDSLAEGEDDAAASVQSVTDIRSKDTAADTLMETLPSIRPMPAPVRSIPAKLANPRTKWRVIAGGGVAVLLLAALGYWLFGVIFKIDTGNGLIQIETNVADVEVFVDDEKVVHITDPKDKTKIKVEVAPGGKTLKVSKDGFEADVTEFKLNTVKGPIKVTFVPVKDLPPTSGTREKLLTATPGDRIDLLKLIDVERDAVAGDWKIVDSALVSPSEWADEQHLPRIVLPHSVPDEYDLHIVTDPEREGRGRTFLGIGLVVGNSQVMLWFDDYHGKSSVGDIDGERKTLYQGRLLTPGVPSRIVCSVRKDTIQVSCDEGVLWDWTGDFSLLSFKKRAWKTPDTSKLFIATRDGAVHKISEISLIPISGGAK
jgi:hypothetical protein